MNGTVRRPPRRGRWWYRSDSTRYGEAGWHLDSSPLVVDWMPDHNDQCGHTRRCRGEYQLHGWPGREHESVACYFAEAMRVIENEWDVLTEAQRQQLLVTPVYRDGKPIRRGRWAYVSHMWNGPVWRLDGTTLDLEHDPNCHAVCIGDRCNGAWILYENGRYREPVAEHLSAAMEAAEVLYPDAEIVTVPGGEL